MNIDELTIGQKKELVEIFGSKKEENQTPFEVGKAYVFRTVTHIDLGIVKRVIGSFVELTDASWIADTGRYHDFLKNGTPREVEPYPDFCGVNINSLCDYAPWGHDLPRSQK